MGYTYDDFLTAANKEGLIKQFTDSDLQIAQKNPEFGLAMLGVMKDSGNATTAEQKVLANEAANQLRKTFGSFGKVDQSDGFQYKNETAYQKALDAVVNPVGFQYDHEQDDAWSAYKKAYLREGERASANALAQASAASGGRPSSYALSVAQQAANYYAGQLADKIPTLKQNAYQQYLNDFEQKISTLSALGGDRSDAYTRWMNAQEVERAALEAQRAQELLALETQREQEQLALETQRAQEQQEYENALEMYQVLGYATPEIAKIMGLEDPGTVQEIDYASIAALGYGDISAEELNEKVDAGEVEEYTENGVLKYRRIYPKVGTVSSGRGGHKNVLERRLTM